jgi:hypothetical protein
MKTTKRGGARENAGRTPIEDKKRPLTIYVRESIINKLGGRIIALQELNKFINKLNK